jgi:hypothetical protein
MPAVSKLDNFFIEPFLSRISKELRGQTLICLDPETADKGLSGFEAYHNKTGIFRMSYNDFLRAFFGEDISYKEILVEGYGTAEGSDPSLGVFEGIIDKMPKCFVDHPAVASAMAAFNKEKKKRLVSLPFLLKKREARNLPGFLGSINIVYTDSFSLFKKLEPFFSQTISVVLDNLREEHRRKSVERDLEKAAAEEKESKARALLSEKIGITNTLDAKIKNEDAQRRTNDFARKAKELALSPFDFGELSRFFCSKERIMVSRKHEFLALETALLFFRREYPLHTINVAASTDKYLLLQRRLPQIPSVSLFNSDLPPPSTLYKTKGLLCLPFLDIQMGSSRSVHSPLFHPSWLEIGDNDEEGILFYASCSEEDGGKMLIPSACIKAFPEHRTFYPDIGNLNITPQSLHGKIGILEAIRNYLRSLE